MCLNTYLDVTKVDCFRETAGSFVWTCSESPSKKAKDLGVKVCLLKLF